MQVVITVARKPLSSGTVAGNVLDTGCGGINIDASRLPGGRWPANLILDATAAEVLDEQVGPREGSAPHRVRRGATTGHSIGGHAAYGSAKPHEVLTGYADSGTAVSRFFRVIR